MKATKSKDIGNDNNSRAQDLDGIIASLLSIIDQIDSCFREAKALILELARRLDEGGVCERGHVCREIKKILKDKISQHKITETWIEECLPTEYKRMYNKSKLSLLSKQEDIVKERCDQRLIQVDHTGEEVMADNKSGEDAGLFNEIQGRSKIEFEGERNDQDTRGYTFLIETPELKIHKSELVFMIHREKYQEVINVMKKSKDFIQIIFDQLGPFVRVQPDVLTER